VIVCSFVSGGSVACHRSQGGQGVKWGGVWGAAAFELYTSESSTFEFYSKDRRLTARNVAMSALGM